MTIGIDTFARPGGRQGVCVLALRVVDLQIVCSLRLVALRERSESRPDRLRSSESF